MGNQKSVYENNKNPLQYHTITPEEYVMIKDVWSDMESNPQFHGNAFFTSFCESYPQYLKYFTLDPNLPLNFHARTITKITAIVEALGYLLLDFHNKPKKLDRLVGYLAMVHKDMRLEKQDIRNFATFLVKYLSLNFSSRMNKNCNEALIKYMNNISDAMYKKMEDFRVYEMVDQPETTKLTCVEFFNCKNDLIFGRTLLYWKERKLEWEERLNEWAGNESKTNELINYSSSDEDEDETKQPSILKKSTSRVDEKIGEDSSICEQKSYDSYIRKVSIQKNRIIDDRELPSTSKTDNQEKFRRLRSTDIPRRNNQPIPQESSSNLKIKTARERRRELFNYYDSNSYR